jgi:hypothetical protein
MHLHQSAAYSYLSSKRGIPSTNTADNVDQRLNSFSAIKTVCGRLLA